MNTSVYIYVCVCVNLQVHVKPVIQDYTVGFPVQLFLHANTFLKFCQAAMAYAKVHSLFGCFYVFNVGLLLMFLACAFPLCGPCDF